MTAGKGKDMRIIFPRGIEIDTENIPDDFDEIIKKCFSEYTNGTRKDYRYQDKLAFIDRCVELLHRAGDEEDAVKTLILDRTEYELDEFGEFPDKDDFWSLDFMCDCYAHGKEDMKMYSNKYYSVEQCMKSGEKNLNDTIMKLLERVIKVVINYED